MRSQKNSRKQEEVVICQDNLFGVAQLQLHYGEAQSAESRIDFIDKMKIALKEMRESLICLKIIERTRYLRDQSIENSISELNELISIFVKSIETAKTNLKDKQQH